jgi:hypothetical protein
MRSSMAYPALRAPSCVSTEARGRSGDGERDGVSRRDEALLEALPTLLPRGRFREACGEGGSGVLVWMAVRWRLPRAPAAVAACATWLRDGSEDESKRKKSRGGR